MKVNIKKLSPDACVPFRASESAAGYDLCACISEEERVVYPDQTIKVKTGIAVEIPDGFFGAIFARSGMATKKGLRPANCVGVIDSDYRGEIIVALHNDTTVQQKFNNGERIAQLVILPYLPVEFCEVDELSSTQRDKGGFGSTGILTPVIEGQMDLFEGDTACESCRIN